jgi:hypothetical protein
MFLPTEAKPRLCKRLPTTMTPPESNHQLSTSDSTPASPASSSSSASSSTLPLLLKTTEWEQVILLASKAQKHQQEVYNDNNNSGVLRGASLVERCLNLVVEEWRRLEVSKLQGLSEDLRYKLLLTLLERGLLDDDSFAILAVDSLGEVLDFSECVGITNETLRCLMEKMGTQLKSLSLKECAQINNQGLIHLSKARELVSLNLDGCFLISRIGLSHLAQPDACTKLSTLDLSGCIYLTDSGVKELLTSLKELMILTLRGCYRVNWNFELEEPHTPNQVLKSLCLSRTSISDLSVALLSKTFVDLRILDISWCNKLTEVSLKFIGARLRKLFSINLWGIVGITDSSVEWLLQRCNSLTSITLANTNIRDDTLLSVMSFTPKIRKLNISGCLRVSHVVLHLLAKYTTDLESFSVSFCNIPSLAIEKILSQCSRLNRIDLATSKLSAEALFEMKTTQLLELDLKRCENISTQSLSWVLKRNPGLNMLNISNCTSLDVWSLASILREHSKALRILHLSNQPHLSDEAIEQLFPSEENPFSRNLEQLSVDSCANLTNAAIRRIFAECPSLQNLSICFLPNIDDTAFDSLWRQTRLELYPSSLSRYQSSSKTLLDKLSRSEPQQKKRWWYNGGGKQLRSLSLWDSRVTDRTIERLAWSCKKLKTLEIPENRLVTDEGIVELVQHCSNLQQLNISRNDNFGDRSVRSIIHKAMNIQYLDLNQISQITDDSLHCIRKSSLALRTLNVSNCFSLTIPALRALIAPPGYEPPVPIEEEPTATGDSATTITDTTTTATSSSAVYSTNLTVIKAQRTQQQVSSEWTSFVSEMAQFASNYQQLDL